MGIPYFNIYEKWIILFRVRYGPYANKPYGNVPIKINIDNIITMRCGYNYSIVLSKNGLFGFGRNFSGQLGTEGNIDINKPYKINCNDVLTMGCENAHTIVYTLNGVFGFGTNKKGELSFNDNKDYYYPEKICIPYIKKNIW